MTARNYAYLDLAALPGIGSAMLSERPTLLWAADGRRLLWANAAGAAFFGASDMATLLERGFSASLPSSDQIARLARHLPLATTRLERIRFATRGGLSNLAAASTRLSLPDGATAVLTALDARESGASLAERANRLCRILAAQDCLVAVLDGEGEVIAASGGLGPLSAGEAAIDDLMAVIGRDGDRLVKRAIRIDDTRRPAGMARAETAEGTFHLLVVGPAERIKVEPVEIVAAPKIAEGVLATVEPMSEPAAEPVIQPAPIDPPVSDEPIDDAVAAEERPGEPPVSAARELDEPVSMAEGEDAIEPVQPEEEADLPIELPDTTEAVTPAEAVALAVERDDEFEAHAPPAAEPDPVSTPPFHFVEPDGPARFVFQMDADGKFSFVSPDFAAVVGPVSAGIVGKLWRDVASARGVDRDGHVASVIARRDTWSGVTLEWPVDGSDARLAVDLAALPAFSRSRVFEGYRGFGVIRPLDRRRELAPAIAAPVLPPTVEPLPSPAPPIASSNIVQLKTGSPISAADAERLSAPEQDAFRRIAVALGASLPGDPPRVEAPAQDVQPSAPAEAEVALAVQDIPQALVEPPVEDRARRAGDTPPLPAEPDPDARLVAAEREIRELSAILDTATDGVIVVNAEGRIDRINRSAEALFGIDAREVVGLPFADLLAEESRKSALDYLDGLASNGVASVLNDGREVIGRVPQGGLIPLFMTMGRVGDTGTFCAVLRDITQWKNAEEELVSARRTAESASMHKSDFLAKVSHEIRTPLNAIIGFSEVMMEERFGPIGTERYKEYLRDIHVSGAHLMSLLNDLLDLSKIESGKLDLTFEAVSLNETVMECVALMQPQANRERIIIRTSLSGHVPSIVADPRSIRQIVLNLVSNAVKFTLAGGQVIVSTAMEENGEVALRIRDTGIGMSARDIETALKPFRQVTTSSRTRNDGTGLGLPLTKALVEANRAAFSIESTVGQGTLIRILFPTTRVLAG